jgi:hypothetical protein
LKVSYIKEANLLGVYWEHNIGHLASTEHDRVLVNVDMEGNFTI